MAVVFPITIDQGANFILGLEMLLGDQPLVLPGSTARMQIRATNSKTSELFFDIEEGNGLTYDPQAGTIAIDLSAARTSAFVVPAGLPSVLKDGRRLLALGYYNLSLYLSDTEANRLLEGQVYFSPEVIL